jgi:tyrosyl-tRNA synthetase
VSQIKNQLSRLLDFSPGKSAATLVNNADWTAGISALDFLRDVGKYITVNQMMAKESVKNRLNSENGLSYTEFSYMLLQANDFRHLCANHDVELQMGGSDQWGNITAGIDLIRKSLSRSAFGATWPLVTKSDGTKFGKTAGGAVWLDAQRTSPYQFRQFWMQMADADVVKYLPQFSQRLRLPYLKHICQIRVSESRNEHLQQSSPSWCMVLMLHVMQKLQRKFSLGETQMAQLARLCRQLLQRFLIQLLHAKNWKMSLGFWPVLVLPAALVTRVALSNRVE